MRTKSSRHKLIVETLERRRLFASDFALIKDINTSLDPWPLFDSVSELTVQGDLGFFGYQDASTGREIWRTDGTPAGTYLLKDITVGPGDSYFYGFTRVGNQIYFTAESPDYGAELWVTDGSTETRLVANINPGSEGSYPGDFRVIGNELFFTAYTGVGVQPAKTDGVSVTLLGDPTGHYQTHLLDSNDYFLVNRNDSVTGLFSIDPSTGIEQQLSSSTAFNGSSTIDSKTLVHAHAILLTDGTLAGTSEVPLPVNGHVSFLGSVSGRWLVSSVGEASSKLWSVSPNGSFELILNLTGTPYSEIFSTAELDGKVAVTSENHGAYVTDGTFAGTQQVQHIPSSVSFYPGVQGSAISDGAFFVQGLSDGQWAFWRIDPTTLEGNQVGSSFSSSAIAHLSVANGDLYWNVNETSLYRSIDGFNSEIVESGWFRLVGLRSLNDNLIFTGIENTGAALRLFSDNETTSLTPVLPSPTASSLFGDEVATVGNLSFFTEASGLWRTDGTEAGTIQLVDSETFNATMLAAGNTKVFALQHGTREVWVSDGTASGTSSLMTLPGDDDEFWITAVGDSFIVGGRSGIWLSDGTLAGTVYTTLNDPSSSGSLSPSHAIVAAGKAYFTTSGEWLPDGSGRNEFVWSSDGTESGTTIVSEGPLKRWWRAATDGSTIVFADEASDLWRSDDGMATVQLIARRQPDDTSIQNVGIASGVVYFDRYEGWDRSDVFRVSSNADSPVYLGNVARTSNFDTIAGEFYLTSLDDAHVYRDNPITNALEVDELLSSTAMMGWGLAAGPSYIIAPTHFPETGIELGRLDRPGQVGLSNRWINENAAVEDVVGSLILNWNTNITDPVTFSLVDGEGDTNNNQFNIDADGNLVVNGALDYEQSTTASVRIRATNIQSTFENRLIILIGDIKDSVDEIELSNNSIEENTALGTVVGVLDSSPSEPGLLVTYSVIAVDGQTSALPFTIVGNELRTASGLDFEAQREHVVTVRAVDSLGRFGEADFVVNVTNFNENATAAIRLTNDAVDEGDIRIVGQLFIPDSSDNSWVYSLSSGPGDYDNLAFSIDADQLSVNEIVDYEARDDYSVHVTATNSSGDSVSAALTVVINPVDEFAPQWIELIYLQGGSIEENTPVGTPVIRLEVIDEDRGDNYQFQGTMDFSSIDGSTDPYLQIVGHEIIVVRPINYENIVPFSGYYSITATAASGNQIGVNGDTVFLREVNDPPTIGSDIPDQDILVNETIELDSSFYDEDQFDSLTFVATLSDGNALPNWAFFDAMSGRITLSPTLTDTGNYSFAITATDTRGASTTDTFDVEVISPVTIPGTAGDDSFTIVSSGVNQWTVRRNGLIVYQGNLSTTAVQIQGELGDDQLIVTGSAGVDDFEVGDGRILADGAKIYFEALETREVRGLGGGDTFSVITSTPTVTAFNAVGSETRLVGGAGRDTVRAVGTSANSWTLTDDGEGSVNGVSFRGIENLIGNENSDYFVISQGAGVSGAIDGRGGDDQLEYISTAGSFDVVVDGSLVTANLIDQIIDVEQMTSNSPSRSSIRSIGHNDWIISGGQVTLGGFAFQGFQSLIGSNSGDDLFQIASLGSTPYEIFGGQGQRTDSIFFADSVGLVEVNAQTNRINNLIAFNGIERFESASYDSSFTGSNRNTIWTISSGNTVNLSTGQTVVGFRQLIGNSRNDDFIFLEESGDFFSAFSPATIDGGAGNDKIETMGLTNSHWQIEQRGGGQFQTIRFSNIEHLASKAVFNTVHFVDVPTTTWFESISGTGGLDQHNQLLYASESNELLLVDLRNQTANGIESLSGFNDIVAFVPNSRLRGRNVDTVWQLTGPGTGTTGLVSFENFQSLLGGNANDTFQINSEVDLLTGLLDGGAGRNTLNYSLVNGIQVDLAAGQASYFPGGIANFMDVIGSAADDTIIGNSQTNLLIGGPGNDTIDGRAGNDSLFGQTGDDILIGASGNDLLVGGLGADQLFGGANSDLLIANSLIVLNDEVSSLEVDRVRVDLLMSVWGSNASYASRANQLAQGVGPGRLVRVVASNIAEDSATDTLRGGDDDDWFVGDMLDILADRLARERMLRI